MYQYIEGKLAEKTPTYVVIDVQGVAYLINISLNTFEQIPDKERCKLYIHFVVREDAQILYGFYDSSERELFRHLISVSGIGANTARLILSSLKTAEIQSAITSGNYNILQKVKGVGAKTAQRLVVDLKDKLAKDADVIEKLDLTHNTQKEEALSALITLGFNKNAADKALNKVIKGNDEVQSVEDLIKFALKIL